MYRVYAPFGYKLADSKRKDGGMDLDKEQLINLFYDLVPNFENPMKLKEIKKALTDMGFEIISHEKLTSEDA